MTENGGTPVFGTTPVGATNGVATFSDLAIHKSGTGYQLKAQTRGGVTLASSSAFNILPGAATAMEVTCGIDPCTGFTPTAASTKTITVTLEDQFDNVLDASAGTYKFTVTLTPGSTPDAGEIQGDSATPSLPDAPSTNRSDTLTISAGTGTVKYTATAAPPGGTGTISFSQTQGHAISALPSIIVTD